MDPPSPRRIVHCTHSTLILFLLFHHVQVNPSARPELKLSDISAKVINTQNRTKTQADNSAGPSKPPPTDTVSSTHIRILN
jgi:hypothetical protein